MYPSPIFRPLALSCASVLLALSACSNPGPVASGTESAPAVSPPQMAMVGAHLLEGLGNYHFAITSKHPEVQRWFAENGVDYMRTYPSSLLGSDSDELFTDAPDNWRLEGWLAQLGWIRALGHEGGLFVTIGRRVAQP